MKKLNKYESQESYSAASNRATDTTNVSLVQGKIVIDAINTPIPLLRGMLRIGDHLVYDKVEMRRKVIRRNGFKLALLDTDRYVDGKSVYFGDIDNRPFFVGVQSLGDKMFSQYSRSKLTGFDLENGGTAKITANSFACEFTYEAGASYSDIATAMTAAKTGSYASYVTFQALADGIGIKSWPTDIAVVSGGLTHTWLKAIKADGTEVNGKVSWDTLANYCDLTEIGYSAMDMRGMDGTGRIHKAQYTEYIRTLATATTFGDEMTAFMNQATFNSCADGTVGGADGIALYNKYGGDWFDYADVCAGLRMIDYDAPYKTAETLRTGEKATKELAAVKLTDFDGSLIDAFPGPAAANAYGITVAGFTTGFEPGNWHELGVGEISRIMREATSRKSTLDANDVLNRAIVAGGGTTILGSTTHQLCGAGSVSSQLIFSGASGYLNGSYGRIYSGRVRVALALEYEDI